MTCRICGAPMECVLDLGQMPLANRLKEAPDQSEKSYPLIMEYCTECSNLQLQYCVDSSELYANYLYITPDSPSLEAHYAKLIRRLSAQGYVDKNSFVVEFGSNVGSFLRRLKPEVGRILGIDPAENICAIARERGIETECNYFGPETAAAIRSARGPVDLIVARHCAAHNENPHLLLEGVSNLLNPDGVFLMENAYGLETLRNFEVGQIYHEHMFFFTVQAVERLFAMHGLRLLDISIEPVHGGSVVFYAGREASRHPTLETVAEHREIERAALSPVLLAEFPKRVEEMRRKVRELVDHAVGAGESIWLYGASAKASTFVNYIGLTRETIPYCADSTPVKQGRFLPRANIMVRPESEAFGAAPDYFLITAWNYADEIVAKIRANCEARPRIIVPHPTVAVLR
jgi:SAM-dependent methyltransferase